MGSRMRAWITRRLKANDETVNNNHYLGLCKVTVPSTDTECQEYACDCDIYNLCLCCSHSIFVRINLGDLDVESLTTKMDKIRGVGRPRRSRGPLDKTDEGPLHMTRKNRRPRNDRSRIIR